MMRNLSLKFIHSKVNSVICSVSSHSIRHTSNVPVPVPVPIRYRDTQIKSAFLVEVIGMTRKKALSTILTKEQFRLTSMDSMKQSFDILKNVGYDSAIENHPELLCIDFTTLKNRILFMEDCGFNKDKIPSLLMTFDSLSDKRLSTLKHFKILPKRVNIIENFFLICNIPLTENTIEFDDWDDFKSIYSKFFKFYVQRELGLDDQEVEIVFKRTKFTSVRYLKYNIKLIRDVFHARKDDLQFIKNLLHANSDSVLYLFKELKNRNMKEMIKKNPKAASVPLETIAKNHKYLQEKNITSVAPTYASLLSMKSELNFNRLSKVLDTYELQVYVNHPRFMKLLNRSFVAYERLEVLKKLNMRCYTLNQLITSDESFIKHISNGIDKVQCRDKVTLLNQELSYTRPEIKQRLHLNPYVGYIPLNTVRETVNYLKTAGFSTEDIFISLPLVLYHRKAVENAVMISVPELLKSMSYSTDYDKTKLKSYLPLVLYCIEKHHNFTGDGVWIQEDEESKEVDLYIA